MGSIENVDVRRTRGRQCRSLKLSEDTTNGNPVWRTFSKLWDKECDPFQVFEVDHEACYHLEVTVHKGEDITKGWGDVLDTPDPYVILRIPGSSNPSKRTSHIDNTVTPLWETTFNFYLDPTKLNLDSTKLKEDLGLILHVTLMDANYTMDEDLGTDTLSLSSLKEDQKKEHVFLFPKGQKVYTTIRIERNKTPDLRFSLSLCEEEKAFLRKRRILVMEALNDLLDGGRGPKSKEQVPVMAVLGSGGGFRAMICFSGVMRALHKSGIMKCATFVSGLSGSSWLISTLYAHDKFPNLTYDEIYEELKESVSNGWKWNLWHMHKYATDMLQKYRRGQPISFTDFFGHLLGDVLLKGKKYKKLSDQKHIVSQAVVPFPLYTCLHAKASVSCKSFSEWVEFSPFEIGIAKYGTFMKTEDFGNKFIVGKIIKPFEEFPLHYLQGVWGSAFTILLKRYIHGKGGSDMVQMMRDANEERALNEQLEEDGLTAEEDTDTDDDLDIEGVDDIRTSSSEDETSNGHQRVSRQNATPNPLVLPQEPKEGLVSKVCRQLGIKTKPDPDKPKPRKISSDNSSQTEAFNIAYKPDKKDKNSNKKKMSMEEKEVPIKHSVCGKKSKSVDQTAQMENSTAFPFELRAYVEKEDEEKSRRISTQSDPGFGGIMHQTTSAQRRKLRMRRQEALKDPNNPSSESSRERWDRKRRERQTRREKTTNNTFIKSLLENSNLLHSRAGRAGEILNPFRGLSLRQTLPLSPFTFQPSEDHDNMERMDISPGCRYESLDNNAKKLFIVDSGLAFNSPYPLLLRPQRGVDIYLSFDFSQRPTDSSMPFKELLIAENWARINRVPFPPIEQLAKEFSKEEQVREVYVFEDPNDVLCPIILHFPLVNNMFRNFSAPGVARETKEELDFADFPIFDDEDQPFTSTNFVYNELQYERLVKLMEFNTLYCLETIKDNLAKVVQKKQEFRRAYVRNTMNKIRGVIKASNRLQLHKGIKIKVNESEGHRMLSAITKQEILKTRSSDSGNSTGDDEFEDALEDLILEDSEEELLATPPADPEDEKSFEFPN